jgi:hypothetical protein
MGRTITTKTDLSAYIGTYVRIAGSDCCWKVIGESEFPDNSIRDVEVLSTVECYYYYSSEILSTMDPIVVTF